MGVEQKSEWIRVWDLLVRTGHWILVAAFFVAYYTEDDFLSAHVWAGYTVAAVVLIRIVWGFVGTTHAKFADFICSPAKSLRYFVNLLTGKAKRYLGHSPAGAAMVVVLLLSILMTGWSGVMVYAYEEEAGPMAGFVAANAGALMSTEIARHDEAFEEKEHFWEETHEVFANLTLLLVILHIGGVLLASRAHHENLVRSMFTGRKRCQNQEQ